MQAGFASRVSKAIQVMYDNLVDFMAFSFGFMQSPHICGSIWNSGKAKESAATDVLS
jgi:hypothetical protein